MSDNCISHTEDCWKTLTDSTNNYFCIGDFETARLRYSDALYLAETLNEHIPACLRLEIPFIQVYVISCNNLATTYEGLGNLEEAGNMLQRVVYYLLHLAGNQDQGLSANELQAELRSALMAYRHFAEKHSLGRDKQEKLVRALQEELQRHQLLTW